MASSGPGVSSALPRRHLPWQPPVLASCANRNRVDLADELRALRVSIAVAGKHEFRQCLASMCSVEKSGCLRPILNVGAFKVTVAYSALAAQVAAEKELPTYTNFVC